MVEIQRFEVKVFLPLGLVGYISFDASVVHLRMIE
jgi:hypothetical protein